MKLEFIKLAYEKRMFSRYAKVKLNKNYFKTLNFNISDIIFDQVKIESFELKETKMKTSYFAKSGKLSNAISIAGKAPDWFTGREYKKLAPKFWFFNKYKQDGDEEFYIRKYKEEVLDKLNPQEVYEELGDNVVLLCWEGKDKFCHRHLVADWLMKNLNLDIQEL